MNMTTFPVFVAGFTCGCLLMAVIGVWIIAA